MKDGYHFILGDKLPTIYDVAIQISGISSFGSDKQNLAISSYVDALLEQWQKSFGVGHTVTRKIVLKRVKTIMYHYDKKIRSREKYGDSSRGIPPKSIRILNREWRMAPAPALGKGGRPTKSNKSSNTCKLTNDTLFDISQDMETLSGEHLEFYLDMKGPRMTRLSEQIDIEYVEDLTNTIEKERANQQEAAAVEAFINPPEFQEVIQKTPVRSQRKRANTDSPMELEPTTSREMATDNRLLTPTGVLKSNMVSPTSTQLYKEPTRDIKKIKEKFKDAIATVSYRTAVSIPKARVATQVVLEKICNHKYYLSVNERDREEGTPVKEDETIPNKKPRSKDDWAKYQYVLPSEKVVGTYKHEKALHQEIAASKTLLSMTSDTRCTLHFDTTGRSRVDGEWPALILNFLSKDRTKCKMLRLRALFFAFEDRVQIVRLIVETFKRLAVASCERSVTAVVLWEKIYAIMTDSVTKNLKVEEGVSEELGTDYVPLHLLCKSHTCEKLDESCINALVYVETELKYSELLIKSQPRLRSFLRQTKCIAVCAMKAMLKLVSHEESGKPTSLAKEFDVQLEKDGLYKSLSLYKERRFTKLGYTAGAILECLPQFREILNQTHLSNMLSEACKLYVDNEYILCAWKALANFTYKVTMPFLNCVEVCDQQELVTILKNLYTDLKDGKMDSLVNYHVPWTHIDMGKLAPESPLDHYLLKEMCKNAAEGVLLQCGREYWVDDEAPRATQIHKLTEEERENIPTENMVSERYLAKFGYLASISAARSNKFFKAKRIRDDLMFAETSNEINVDRCYSKVTKVLNEMEVSWTKGQKELWKTKVQECAAKKKRSMQYKSLLLKKCKMHGGPFTDLKELKEYVNSSNDKKELKKDLRQEIGYQKMIHPMDVKERSHLYKMNFLSLEEIIENLSILLNEDSEDENEADVDLPSEEDMMEILLAANTKVSRVNEEEQSCFKYLQPLAVLWDGNDNKRYWCIGFFLNEIDDITIRVDHLTQKQLCDDWIRPEQDDIQEVLAEYQVLPCTVDGEWINLNSRVPKFRVKNTVEIQKIFNDYI